MGVRAVDDLQVKGNDSPPHTEEYQQLRTRTDDAISTADETFAV